MDWTKVWSKKYPILKEYKDKIDNSLYEKDIEQLMDRLKKQYDLNNTDTVLIFKDIVYQIYLKWQKQDKSN